jgi:hypothetical protein
LAALVTTAAGAKSADSAEITPSRRLHGSRFARGDVPDEVWVAARLGKWAARSATDANLESLLRLALESVAAVPVIAVGKRRGFIRLRFRVNARDVLAAAVGDSLPAPVRRLPSAPDGPGPEFTLGLGEPTAMDRRAPRVAAWRAQGVTWEEIARRTGMGLHRVYDAWKRHTGAAGGDKPAACVRPVEGVVRGPALLPGHSFFSSNSDGRSSTCRTGGCSGPSRSPRSSPRGG